MTPEKMRSLLKNRGAREEGYRTILVHRTVCDRKKDKILRTRIHGGYGGVVRQIPAESRRILPEENREEDAIVVYSTFDLTEGTNRNGRCFLQADLIEPFPGNGCWRVVRSKHWKEYGFTQALAVRTEEDPYRIRTAEAYEPAGAEAL